MFRKISDQATIVPLERISDIFSALLRRNIPLPPSPTLHLSYGARILVTSPTDRYHQARKFNMLMTAKSDLSQVRTQKTGILLFQGM